MADEHHQELIQHLDDIKQLIEERFAEAGHRLDEVAQRLDGMDDRIDRLWGRTQLLIDSYGMFRSDYLRDHPHPDQEV